MAFPWYRSGLLGYARTQSAKSDPVLDGVGMLTCGGGRKKGIGERADAVWATLQKQEEDTLGTRAKEDLEAVAEQSVAAVD